MVGKQIVIYPDSNLPVQHQFGKMMVGTIGAFVMTKLAEAAYELWVIKKKS